MDIGTYESRQAERTAQVSKLQQQFPQLERTGNRPARVVAAMNIPAVQAAQQKIKAILESCGLPYKQIECYGSQIVVTSHCHDTANKWARLLTKFAKVRGVIKTVDYAKENKGTCMLPTMVQVWRTFAAI